MPSLIQRIQSKLELFRLERRYTRNRDRRSTFVSNAIYVDGEYIYQTPSSTGSTYNSSNNSSANSTPVSEHPPSPLPGNGMTSMPRSVMPAMSSSDDYNNYNTYNQNNSNDHQTTAQRKKMHRFSSIHGFGSSGKGSNSVAPSSNWRPQRASYDGGR